MRKVSCRVIVVSPTSMEIEKYDTAVAGGSSTLILFSQCFSFFVVLRIVVFLVLIVVAPCTSHFISPIVRGRTVVDAATTVPKAPEPPTNVTSSRI